MKRTEFSDRQLADMIMGLIGEVEPVGETNTDNKRFDNLIKLQKTVNNLLYEIYCVCGYVDNVEYSMHRAGEKAVRWMKDLKDWLDEVLEE